MAMLNAADEYNLLCLYCCTVNFVDSLTITYAATTILLRKVHILTRDFS